MDKKWTIKFDVPISDTVLEGCFFGRNASGAGIFVEPKAMMQDQNLVLTDAWFDPPNSPKKEE